MRITEQEIKDILPSGYKIILDREYNLPKDDDVLSSAKRFVKHRYLLTELKKVLDSDADIKQVIDVVKKCFGVVRPFDFKKESNDCDNASVGMLDWFNGMGYPLALAILDGHGPCLYINENKKLKYVESQTGEPMKTDKRLKITVMP